MPDRDALVHEAAELLVLYHELARRTTAPNDLAGMSVAIARALENLDLQDTRGTLDRAARELAAVRGTLARVRRALDDERAPLAERESVPYVSLVSEIPADDPNKARIEMAIRRGFVAARGGPWRIAISRPEVMSTDGSPA